MAAVEKALKELSNGATCIDLDGNEIGDEGVKALAAVLKDNTTLQQLDLSLNDIGDEGGKALAAVLKDNTTLQQLDLSGTPARRSLGIALHGRFPRGCD